MAGPIKTKLGIGTHVDPTSVLVKDNVIRRHLVNANKTLYRGPQGPTEFAINTADRPARPREFEFVPARERVLTASDHIKLD